MHRKILIIIILFLLSGCNLEYNLSITANKQFNEEVIITLDRNLYHEDNQAAERQLRSEIEEILDFSKYQNYGYDLDIRSDNIYISIEATYKNFDEFRKSPIIGYVFQAVYYTEFDYYTLRTGGQKYNANRGVRADSERYLKEIEVNIRAHNHIAGSNAHEEDLRRNVATWYFTNGKIDEHIEIDLDYTKRYDIIILDFIKDNLLLFIVGLGSIVAAIIASISFVINNRKRNQI